MGPAVAEVNSETAAGNLRRGFVGGEWMRLVISSLMYTYLEMIGIDIFSSSLLVEVAIFSLV